MEELMTESEIAMLFYVSIDLPMFERALDAPNITKHETVM